MKILSLNCGSSSLKYSVFDAQKNIPVCSGIVERIGISGSFLNYEALGKEKITINKECSDHKEAIKLVIDALTDKNNGVLKNISEIAAVGHRVVHGGEKFTKSVIINREVLKTFKELADLAPLHNPPNIMGIEAAMDLLPSVKHMAIMDTAWHQTMPPSSYTYALPHSWYSKYAIRRYGFHGTSFLYVAKRAAVLLGKDPFKTNLIIAHIGNGASINAVKNGCSFDTSMGFTPLEGLVMGTRAGDHDPAIGLYVMQKENKNPKEMDSLLNKKSGILGITERFADRRDVEIEAEKGDEKCKLAIEIEGYRIKKYIGAYAAALGGVDAVIFTAGVGEKGAITREKALEGLEFMGVKLDKNKNAVSKTRNAETEISSNDSKVKIFVIPTDEERVFVEDVIGLLKGNYDIHTRFSYSFQKPDYVNAIREDAFKKELEEKPKLALVAVRPPVQSNK
ncbi:MAG: acetate kinase [Elusimicrobia bacterium]|nr:acetate kinase [Elusimicrobiota bacterium]